LKQDVAGLIGINSWLAGFIVNNALLAKSLELVEFSELQELRNKIIDCRRKQKLKKIAAIPSDL
jgi:hypothetical protein